MKDELFLRGRNVPMTKEAVRALVLSRLELHHASHLIDVGAGTGSVSIEAALNHPLLRVTAIERNLDALTLLAENRRHFGCQNIEIIAGEAPRAIDEKADAIFIGGSGGHLTALIDWALAQLRPEGRLVLTFILQENVSTALKHFAACGIEVDCLQLHVAGLMALGNGHYFKPNNSVFMISCQKDNNHG